MNNEKTTAQNLGELAGSLLVLFLCPWFVMKGWDAIAWEFNLPVQLLGLLLHYARFSLSDQALIKGWGALSDESVPLPAEPAGSRELNTFLTKILQKLIIWPFIGNSRIF